MVLPIVKFAIRTALVICLIEYFAPDFFVHGIETTATAVGKGTADGMWTFFKTIGGHVIHG